MNPTKTPDESVSDGMNSSELLIRIDERTSKLMNDFAELAKSLSSTYVRKEEFAPVQKIAYGLVGMIVVGVVGALLALVLR